MKISLIVIYSNFEYTFTLIYNTELQVLKNELSAEGGQLVCMTDF